MNPSSGSIAYYTNEQSIPAGHVEVKRPLTIREEQRMKIDKYAPCGCGSGKKFKFCCYKPA